MAVLSVTVPRLVPTPCSDSGEETTIDTAVPLLLIAAVLQFFDCAQHIEVVLLRGLDDTRGRFRLTVVGHWLVGLPVGALLGLAADLNTFGVRLGLLTGLPMPEQTPRPDVGPMPPTSPAFLLAALGDLKREPAISYSELGRRAGVTTQSAQATVRQIEERGAVERRSLPGRGHTAELHIATKGHDLLEAGKRAYASSDVNLSHALDSEQLTALTGLLLTALSARQPGP